MKKYVIFYYEKIRGQKSREVCYTLFAKDEKAAAAEFEYRVFISGEIDNFVDSKLYRVEAL